MTECGGVRWRMAGGRPAAPAGARLRRPAQAVLTAVITATLAAGCSAGPAAQHGTGRPEAPRLPATAQPGGPLVRVPHADYSDPASVAAAFYVAWASVGAGDGPSAFVARCAPLVTAALDRQLAASQPATGAWEAMQRDGGASLAVVRAVTHPAGAPAPTSSVVYLRVYATQVTTSTEGRMASSSGITLQLTRSGGRWLVNRVLFY